jgi:hypothetical protein
MNTTNLISTPEITGNIGSCITDIKEIIVSRSSIFTFDMQTVATNSCNGTQEIIGEYWQFSGLFFFTIFLMLILLGMFIVSIAEARN